MKTYQTLESLSGYGVLKLANAHLAKVFYHLLVRQASPAGDATRQLEITGEVNVSQDEPMQTQVLRRVGSGEVLTLHLADGRQVDVIAAKGNPLSDAYQIVGQNPANFPVKVLSR